MSGAGSGSGAPGPRRPDSSGARRFCDETAAPQSSRAFLRFRFVEAVATCFPNLPVPREEGLVDVEAVLAQLLALQRADDDVFDAGALQQRGRVGRARVDALQLGLARPVIDAVRPDVAGVAEVGSA